MSLTGAYDTSHLHGEEQNEGKSTKKVWCVGEKCMAFYSGDGQYYKAVIKSIQTLKDGKKVAVVKYEDYDSDDEETLPFSQLRERCQRRKSRKDGGDETSTSASDSSMFSPLRGSEVSDRIRAKYADLMEDDEDARLTQEKCRERIPRRLLDAPSPALGKTRKRKKGVVVTGGGILSGSQTKSPKLSSDIEKSPASVGLTRHQADVDKLVNTVTSNQGFEDKDLERPYFPGVPNPDSKEPFLLDDSIQPTIQVADAINRYLREYQRQGVKFLYEHYKNGQGAILGDDMGLGKTIQVIAFICGLLGKTGTREDCQRSLPEFLQKKSELSSKRKRLVFLIASPKSVMYNWLEELETWSYCVVGKYHGKDREETLLKAMKGKLDVVLTTHETVRVSVDDINRVNWSAVIIDEVHKIKEPGAQVTKAFKTLRCKYRYGLTGTALQNHVMELWCVLDWANPGCLGDYMEFKNDFENVIIQGQRFDANKRQLASARKKSCEFAKMRDKWLLRRTKALIADQLPVKDEKVVFCNLSDFQTCVYKEVLESDDMQLVLRQQEDCDCGSSRPRGRCCHKKNEEGYSIKQIHFIYLAFLIKVANHVALLLPRQGQSEDQKRLAQKICDKVFTRYPRFLQATRQAAFASLSNPTYCGKMKILVKLLDNFKKEDSKILLFSYYTKLLDILEEYIQSRGMEYRRIDGKTAGPLRTKYVREFNRDKQIFLCLISTKAGGLGLNMTGANVVIIFDPNWNPAHDQQAQDRAYRIGQHRDVRVYRLISVGTVEENMYLRQVYKQQVASTTVQSELARRYFVAVAGSNKHTGELFGPENIFRLGTEGCLTKDLIEREQTVENGIKMAKYIRGVNTPAQEEKVEDSIDENEESEAENDVSDEWISSQLSADILDVNTDRDSGDNSAGVDDTEKKTAKSNLPFLHKSDSDSDCESADASDSKLREFKSREHLSKSANNSNGKHVSSRVQQQRRQKQQIGQEERKNICTDGKTTRHEKTKNKTKESSEDNTVCKRKSGGRKRKGGKYKPDDFSMKGKGKVCKKRTRYKDSSDGSSDSESDGCREDGGIRRRKVERKKGVIEKTETIDGILKDCGVSYIHCNAKIIGGSKVEEHVSKCAIQDVYVDQQYSQQPANCNIQTYEEEESDESDDLGLSRKPSLPRTGRPSPQPGMSVQQFHNDDVFGELLNPVILHGKRESYQDGNTTVILGDTPQTIRRQQFSDMTRKLGMKSQAELAEVVLRADSQKRLDLLTQFYRQTCDLSGVGNLFVVKCEEVTDDKEQKKRSQIKNKKQIRDKPEKTRVVRKRQWRRKRVRVKEVMYSSDSSDTDTVVELATHPATDTPLPTVKAATHRTTSSREKSEETPSNSASASEATGAQTAHRDTSKIVSNKADANREKVEDSGDKKSQTRLLSIHKEDNYSFLDEIFLSDDTRKRPDCKQNVEDTDVDNHQSVLWKKNLKYNELPEGRDSDSDSTDVFIKYAESFITNDKYQNNA